MIYLLRILDHISAYSKLLIAQNINTDVAAAAAVPTTTTVHVSIGGLISTADQLLLLIALSLVMLGLLSGQLLQVPSGALLVTAQMCLELVTSTVVLLCLNSLQTISVHII